jgi:hypothetical protein
VWEYREGRANMEGKKNRRNRKGRGNKKSREVMERDKGLHRKKITK